MVMLFIANSLCPILGEYLVFPSRDSIRKVRTLFRATFLAINFSIATFHATDYSIATSLAIDYSIATSRDALRVLTLQSSIDVTLPVRTPFFSGHLSMLLNFVSSVKSLYS